MPSQQRSGDVLAYIAAIHSPSSQQMRTDVTQIRALLNEERKRTSSLGLPDDDFHSKRAQPQYAHATHLIPNFPATHVLMLDRNIEIEVNLLRSCFPQLEVEYNISRRALEVHAYLCTSVLPVSYFIPTGCRPASHACVAGRVRHYVCIETVCH